MDKNSILRKTGDVISRFNDIDVALVLSKELNPYSRFKFAMKVAKELEREIKPRFEFDVKILNYCPVEFQHEVLKESQIVFLRDENRRIEYESKLISTYLDLREMYDFLDKKFLAKV